ncbi:GNAT family N-acetyltransferase [Bradyrhizobium prioriisuperbiae]|uniref:GNAT family N-acetyltransferase n=1 Tax=Bradyrhizobium prioriisuperbiae TaxID=2854389 RepID=UPI0028E35077|nr:GNAT family N-acetyltransferase [Bradyrhizobium prioritasuperba]
MTDAADMMQRTKALREAAEPRSNEGANMSWVIRHAQPRLRRAAPRHDRLVPLSAIANAHWQELADRAAEPNGYYLPDWEAAVNASARDRGGALALTAWGHAERAGAATSQLIGLLPAISAWRAYRIPIAALVSADPYGPLGTPLLDQDATDDAVRRMLRQARDAGMHALILRDVPLQGPVLAAFTHALARDGLAPRILQSRERVGLDATRDAEEALRDALGSKKLKELRRQRNRLAEHGEIALHIARRPDEILSALEIFLSLEASGWKAKRGTALAQHEGDLRFMRQAASALGARGLCEVVTLTAGATPVASGVVLRHRDRAYWFKLGIDERFAKMSPGVQLALELTRHLCADPAIAFVDSSATADHPMIGPIWRNRFTVGDVLIPLRRHDPAVAAIRIALRLRQLAREPARRLVHFIRALKERRR